MGRPFDPNGLMSKGLDVGDIAPDFSLPSTDGNFVLYDRLAHGPILLVFYPGDDTPVCTKQLCDYRDNLSVFEQLGVQVAAINKQGMSSHDRFSKKHQLPFPLLADENKAVCKAYGAIGLLGMVKRALFLVGEDRVIRYRQVDLPMFRKTADELQEALDGLVDSTSADTQELDQPSTNQ